MNDHIKKKKASAEAKMRKNEEAVTDLSSGKVDVSDLEKAAEDDPKGWFGESVVMCDFILTGVNK